MLFSKMEEKKKQLEEELKKESQQMDLHLDEDQLKEYHRLKTDVDKQTLRVATELDNKKQEQETDRNAVEYEKRRLDQWDQKIKSVCATLSQPRKSMSVFVERSRDRAGEAQRRSLQGAGARAPEAH